MINEIRWNLNLDVKFHFLEHKLCESYPMQTSKLYDLLRMCYTATPFQHYFVFKKRNYLFIISKIIY